MRRIYRSIALVALGTVIPALSCMRATPAAEAIALSGVPVAAPKLVVFITVDQLRGDMLDRYASQLRYGYARLMRGAWFVNGYQDHAITETAPGHASTMSGRFPRNTGIVENAAGVNDTRFPVIGGLPNEPGASPERFVGSTLFDWLATKDRAVRALSVSRKDRGAILPIGRAKQDVYWYSSNGTFTTSTYYRSKLPDWVEAFNARRIPQRYAGARWSLLRDSSFYPEPDSVPEENGGRSVLPIQLSADTARATAQLISTPMLDSVTALFALEGLRRTGLGQGPQTDILAVSFSSTDAVGHAFGPDSREAHDNELRLDQTLGWFLDSLYAMRDSGSVLIALTADHGVSPIPALARRRGEAKGDEGLIVSLASTVAAFKQSLAAAGVDSGAFLFGGELVGLDRDRLRSAKVNADSILDAFRGEALKVPGVARVDRARDIHRADHALDPIARRWSHQISPNSPVDLVITLTRYSYWYRATATHGSPYDQDAHVPIIFYGPWAKPGRYTDFVRTVDMAPTLAAMIGIAPTEKLDGVVLQRAINR